MREDMREDVAAAVRLRLEDRGYHEHPAEEELFDEVVEEITDDVMDLLKDG